MKMKTEQRRGKKENEKWKKARGMDKKTTIYDA